MDVLKIGEPSSDTIYNVPIPRVRRHYCYVCLSVKNTLT